VKEIEKLRSFYRELWFFILLLGISLLDSGIRGKSALNMTRCFDRYANDPHRLSVSGLAASQTHVHY